MSPVFRAFVVVIAAFAAVYYIGKFVVLTVHR